VVQINEQLAREFRSTRAGPSNRVADADDAWRPIATKKRYFRPPHLGSRLASLAHNTE